jgi:hypothetical protein
MYCMFYSRTGFRCRLGSITLGSAGVRVGEFALAASLK